MLRHSEDMIKKLESAGLGFYVRETDTHQKLGNGVALQIIFNSTLYVYFLHLCVHMQVKSLSASWFTVY